MSIPFEAQLSAFIAQRKTSLQNPYNPNLDNVFPKSRDELNKQRCAFPSLMLKEIKLNKPYYLSVFDFVINEMVQINLLNEKNLTQKLFHQIIQECIDKNTIDPIHTAISGGLLTSDFNIFLGWNNKGDSHYKLYVNDNEFHQILKNKQYNLLYFLQGAFTNNHFYEIQRAQLTYVLEGKHKPKSLLLNIKEAYEILKN